MDKNKLEISRKYLHTLLNANNSSSQVDFERVRKQFNRENEQAEQPTLELTR